MEVNFSWVIKTLLSPHNCNNDTSTVSLLSAALHGICLLSLMGLKFLLLDTSLCGQCTGRPNKPKCHSWKREQFIAEAMQGDR